MNVKKIRSHFSILDAVDTKPFIYLDNAATTLKPRSVIDAIVRFYEQDYATVGRGIYARAERATQLYESARATVADWIGAAASDLVFTSGATQSINLVARAWGDAVLQAGDEIIVTQLEHHANLVPWQQLCKRTGAVLRVAPITQEYTLDMNALYALISPKTKLVAITHESNLLGTRVDLKPIIDRAHDVGAAVLVDASQSVPHERIDINALACDFLVFSAHKMLGPTGIGALYIRSDLHKKMDPYQFGGGMIYSVDQFNAKWLQGPQRFEAGTPPIAQAIGFAAAIDFLNAHVNFDWLKHHEASLCARLIDGCKALPGVRILGPVSELRTRGHLVTLVIDGYHAHDIAAYLDQFGICIRAGNHCAQPLSLLLDAPSSIRASFYMYNTIDEVNQFVERIAQLVQKR